MSFHLEGPWLSTTRTQARGEKTTKAQREQLERDWRERNVRLRSMGLPKESFEQFLEWVYGRGKAVAHKDNKTQKTTPPVTKTYQGTKKKEYSSSNDKKNILENTQAGDETKMGIHKPTSLGSWVTGPVSSKPSPVYTGSKVKGIAQMAKSNAVPVFNQEEIIDISKMRR